MADLVAADVTYTEAGYPFRQLQEPLGRFSNKVTVTFGDGSKTYPAGGIPLVGNSLGMPVGIVESIAIQDQTVGDRLDWYWDATTGKLRAYKAPVNEPIVEELVPVTANVGVLKQLPCYVFMVCGLTASDAAAVPCNPRRSGVVPNTTEVSINFTTGTLTFAAADNIVTARVSYLPLACLAKPSDLVIEEAGVPTSNVVTLANQACAVSVFEAVTGTVNGLNKFREAGRTPLTHEVAIKFNDTGSTTTGTFLGTDVVLTTVCTYIKRAAFTFINDTSITLASAAGPLPGSVIPAFGCYAPVTAATAATHTGATKRIALANLAWSFTPGIGTLTTGALGFQVACKAASAATAVTFACIAVPEVGPVGAGQLALEELRSPLIDPVPPQSLVLRVVGY